MGTTFRPYDPDQQLLLPQDLREWVPAGHPAHHVSDLVDALDLSAFYARYEGDGRRRSPYDPRMMVKVLVYGYATGVFSSRKLEEDVPLRMLAAGNFPQHRTLCEFRKPGARRVTRCSGAPSTERGKMEPFRGFRVVHGPASNSSEPGMFP